MILRHLNLLKNNSFFLFGARGVGKTTLLKATFQPSEYLLFDLLKPDLYSSLLARPEDLTRLIAPAIRDKKWVIIDEIQKIPALLDLVHYHIENSGLRFALTGSSARKLKRGASNLLAGRAFTFKLYPLLYREFPGSFSIESALQWGTLPTLLKLNADLDRSLYLQSYSSTYLREEIVTEQIVRNLPPFTRFLQVAAQASGSVVNYAAIAAAAQTNPSNIKNYFQILEDTLLGFFLEPYDTSIRNRIRKSPKFYLIDCGIQRALSNSLDVRPKAGTYDYGKLFEAFLINQIRTHLEYSFKQYRLSYMLTNANAEVDLIIERKGQPTFLIEIKSSNLVRDEKLIALKRLARDIPNSKPFCLYTGSHEILSDGVEILPWERIFGILG